MKPQELLEGYGELYMHSQVKRDALKYFDEHTLVAYIKHAFGLAMLVKGKRAYFMLGMSTFHSSSSTLFRGDRSGWIIRMMRIMEEQGEILDKDQFELYARKLVAEAI